MEDREQAPPKPKKSRSPAYPGISLPKAIERAREFWTQEKKHAAPITAAAAHWGFKPKSSGGLVTVAALKQFGLLQDSGSGSERKVQLTEAGQRIIQDERDSSPDRDKLIKTAALRPKIYAELWNKWGAELPSEQTIRTHLVMDRGYNKEVVDSLLRAYKDTTAFAKLSASDTVSESDEDTNEEMEELGGERMEVEERGDRTKRAPTQRTGERELVRLPLAGDRLVRLIFAGPTPTQKHIEKLIALLELSKDTFPADESDE